MDTITLKRINKQIRNKRPCLSTKELCSIFRSGDLLEIGFLSKQCKNDLSGSCLMCDYGYMHQMGSLEEYIREMKAILAEYTENIDYLLLCTNGSILDSYQISTEILTAILIEAQKSSIPNIIIETHYKDVTKDKLDLINRIVEKPITIEMGLETINPKYQDALFMKGISIKKYLSTIQLIKKYNYNIEINIMLGLPFLSPKQQIDDAINTIEWAVCQGCSPVLFPLNIKYFTFLRYMYDKKVYTPISLWLVVILLDKLSDKALQEIIIAWYGNRDESYSKDSPTIMPQACRICKPILNKFFQNFLRTDEVKERKLLISNLMSQSACECLTAVKGGLKQPDSNFEENYQKLFNQIVLDFGIENKGEIND